MSEPEVALVFSPETWVEGLHRHLTDHGGARVRQVVMDPALALEEEYGTLIVSHRWPGLNRAFVETVHAHRRRLLGVFDPDEPAGREYLLQLGADRVIESDAPMSDFLAAVAALAPIVPVAGVADRELHAILDRADETMLKGDASGFVVVAGPAGEGATEIAIELARDAADGARTVLVDADDVAPAVAQRLARTVGRTSEPHSTPSNTAWVTSGIRWFAHQARTSRFSAGCRTSRHGLRCVPARCSM